MRARRMLTAALLCGLGGCFVPIPDVEEICSSPSCTVYIEAESGSGRYVIFSATSSDAASGGKYISASASNYDAAAADSDTAETLAYAPEVTTSGVHSFWVRVRATESLQNSLFISVNGGPFEAQDLGTGSDWRWVRMKHLDSLQLEPGVVSVRIKNREKGACIDRLFITNNPDQVP